MDDLDAHVHNIGNRLYEAASGNHIWTGDGIGLVGSLLIAQHRCEGVGQIVYVYKVKQVQAVSRHNDLASLG